MRATWLFLLVLNASFALAQDDHVADSLKQYLNDDLAVEQRVELLDHIAFHSTLPDSILKFGQQLVELGKSEALYEPLKQGLIHMGTAARLKGDYEKAFLYYSEAENLIHIF